MHVELSTQDVYIFIAFMAFLKVSYSLHVMQYRFLEKLHVFNKFVMDILGQHFYPLSGFFYGLS